MIRTLTNARRAAAAATLVALAACSGGKQSIPAAPVADAVAPAASPGALASSTTAVPYGASLMTGATYLGPAKVATIGLTVQATMRDSAGLVAYARDANTPGSGTYRQWLTPAQIGDRFGAPQADYAALTAYFTSRGIAVKTYPQRMSLRIRGPQGNVEHALGTTFGVYRSGKQTFLAPTTAPTVSTSLKIAALTSAVGRTKRSRDLVRVANSYVTGYTPQQIQNAFDYTGAYNAGYKGDGISVGIIGTGPITDGDPRVAGGDVADYKKLFGLGGTGTVTQVYDTSNVSPGNTSAGAGQQYSSGLATPPPATSGTTAGCQAQGYDPTNPGGSIVTDFTTCNPEDGEAQLDTEQIAGLAPDASELFYIAYNPAECFATGSYSPGDTCPDGSTATGELGITLTDDEIQQAVADDRSDVVSMSFGGGELDSEGYYFGSGSNNFGPTELAALASEGVALFASSGDSGSAECSGTSTADSFCVSYPATDPSVVSVGGVNAPLDQSGRLTGPLTGWGSATQGFDYNGASGGGCSTYFTAPPYEAGISGFPCSGKRAQPDVSLDADLSTGISTDIDAAPGLGGRLTVAIGGTSVAAPEMAAMWALVLQACKQTSSCATGSGAHPYRLGNPNAKLFAGYTGSAYPTTFYDVLTGYNGVPNSSGDGSTDPGFNAGKGYDLVTGIGVPYARNLIKAVVGV